MRPEHTNQTYWICALRFCEVSEWARGQLDKQAQETGVSTKELKQIIASLHEFNPMCGFRGCRIGLKYPAIMAMQAKAIFNAALQVKGA